MTGKKRVHAGSTSVAGLSVVLALLLAMAATGSARADEGTADPLAASAEEFCRLFTGGNDDQARERMATKMRETVTPAMADQIRDSLTGPNGALKRLGEAWKEDEIQGYVRYRVPAEFEKAVLDLRVVFDGEGKVAGFFQVPHVDPPGKAQAAAGPNPAVEGHWEGAIEIPGQALPVVVDLTFADGAWTGTFDSPLQGATGIPLGRIVVKGDKVGFVIQGIPGSPTFDGKLRDGEIVGTFTQMGQSHPFTLGRDGIALPGRPQEPEPPFPYDAKEVEVQNGEVRLACTLTLPKGDGPFPAVMLITGSGPQDRDEQVFGHKPFLVLADHLTRAGVTVLRCDDRGVGGSVGDVATSTSDDLAGDALAGVAFLRGQAAVDPKRVGLIGHSEGGIVAPLAASRSDKVAFVIMLAGTGVPGDEVLVRQIDLLARAGGAEDETVDAILAEQRRLLDLILEGAEAEQLIASYRKLTTIQLATVSAEPESGELEAAIRDGVRGLTTPWFRHFLAYDPRPALRALKVPVLALNGELDLQVDPAQNLPEIRKALEQGGNPDFTVKELPGLNHLFQKAQSGSVGEYAVIEETLNPAALDAIRDWVLERFGNG
jgi:pimeloyl-ACP methyl ester carboxylesterase